MQLPCVVHRELLVTSQLQLSCVVCAAWCAAAWQLQPPHVVCAALAITAARADVVFCGLS